MQNRNTIKKISALIMAIIMLLMAAPVMTFADPAIDSIDNVSAKSSGIPQPIGNPYLPLWEHLPDNEPRVFEDPDNPGKYRAYIIGSHDLRRNSYCGPDIRVWSAPVEDLSDWRDDGAVFTYRPNNTGNWDTMYAPDLIEVRRFAPEVIERGRTPEDERTIVEYYLYPHSTSDNGMVCKSDRPDGPFVPVNLGSNGRSLPGSIVGFDPSAWVDYIDDPADPDYNIGFRAYVYYGFQRSYADELDQNTLWSRRPGTSRIDYFMPSSSSYGNIRDPQGTVYPCLAEGEDPKNFNFFEAASMRKVGNKYIMVFSGYSGPEYGLGSTNSALRWAYGDSPLGPFKSGGVLVDSRGPVLNQNGTGMTTGQWGHNTHGSLWEINGQWYTTYHRPVRGNGNARQAVVAPIKIEWTEPSVLEGGTVSITGYDPYAEDERWTAKTTSDIEYRGAEVTSEGFYIYGLPPYRYYSAGLVCDSQGSGTVQDSYDIWDNHMPIENVQNGYRAGFKYFSFEGLDEPTKGLLPFEGTKPGNNTKFNLWLTPRTANAFSVQVWLDGPWANDTWKGTQIGTINVPAGSEQVVTQYSIDVSEYVDNLDGKHAIYLVVNGGSGNLCNLIGLGFSSDEHAIERPVSPSVSIAVDGVEQTIPALPIASTNANGIVDYFRYQVSTSRPAGDAIITASSSDPSVKVLITQAPTGGAGAVRYIYDGVTKLYRLFQNFTNVAATEVGEADATAILEIDSLIGNSIAISGSGFESSEDKIAKASQILDTLIGDLGVDYTITDLGEDLFSLTYSKGNTSMTIDSFKIIVKVDTVTVEGYTGLEVVMDKTLDLDETTEVTINAYDQTGNKTDVTSSANISVSVRNSNVASYENGVVKGLGYGRTILDVMYTDSENNKLQLPVQITVGTEIEPSADAIYVNGALVPNFSPDKTSSSIVLPTMPAEFVLTADLPGAGLDYSYEMPTSLPGNATLTVTSAWGKSFTYTININVQAPELTSISFNGDTFDVTDIAELDVSVPKEMSNISFSAEDVTSAYADDLDIDVKLSPENGKVSVGAPCVAKVTVGWKGHSNLSKTTYTVNFGKMTVTWEPDQNNNGYTTSAKVRFSDGTTKVRLIQAWYMEKTGILDVVASESFQAVPKHGSDLLTFTNGESTLPTEWLVERTLSKYVWDTDNNPLATPVRYDWLPPVIDGIRVGSTNVSDFDPSNLEYAYEVPFGASTPNVTASYDSSKMTVRVTQASSIPGSAVITATNPHGTASTIYKVNFTRAANPNKVTAVKATPANHLDPNDPAWDVANEILVDKRSTTNQSASMVASGKAKVLWDDNYLYARIEVTKNYALNNANSSSHLQDSVELFFSERNFRGSYGSTVANGNQYRVNYLGALSQKTSASGWTGSGTVLTDLPEGQYGYVLTYRIPWVDSNVSKTPGTALGLDFQINAMQNSSTRTCFAWADTTDSGYNSSNLWGEVILG